MANLALQGKRWLRHLDLVKNELGLAADAEKCWLKESSWSKSIIQKISSVTDIAQIQDLTVLFASTSPDPVTQLFKCLHREMTTLPKNKKNLIAVLKLLGTQAIRRGLTVSDVNLDSPEMYHENHREIADCLQGLFEAESRQFYCVVRLNGDSSHIHSLFARNGFQKARIKDFPLDKVGQNFKDSISRQIAFRYDTQAISHIAAADHAVQACRRVIDVFNLYKTEQVLN